MSNDDHRIEQHIIRERQADEIELIADTIPALVEYLDSGDEPVTKATLQHVLKRLAATFRDPGSESG